MHSTSLSCCFFKSLLAENTQPFKYLCLLSIFHTNIQIILYSIGIIQLYTLHIAEKQLPAFFFNQNRRNQAAAASQMSLLTCFNSYKEIIFTDCLDGNLQLHTTADLTSHLKSEQSHLNKLQSFEFSMTRQQSAPTFLF